MTQAFLPQNLYEPTIENMMPGDEGWTVPWALMVDQAGLCWLRTDFTHKRCKGGTVKLHLQREDDVDGVQFWIATLYDEYRWKQNDSAVEHFYNLGYLVPIAEYHHTSTRLRARPLEGVR